MTTSEIVISPRIYRGSCRRRSSRFTLWLATAFVGAYSCMFLIALIDTFSRSPTDTFAGKEEILADRFPRTEELFTSNFSQKDENLTSKPSNISKTDEDSGAITPPLVVPEIYIPVPVISAPPGISPGLSNTTVLTTTNSVFLDITYNMLASIASCGVSPNITIVAEDEFAYEMLKKRKNIQVWKTRFEEYPKELLKNSPPFKTLVNQRYAYVKDLLDNGTSVLFSDADLVWLANPFKYFKGDYDIYVEEDTIRDKVHPNPFFSAGFVFYRATNRTRAFIDKLMQWIKISGGKSPDQNMMNKIIEQKVIPDLNVKILSSNIFPHGKLYYNYKWRVLRNSPIVIHFNYIPNHDRKVKRLKQMGLWYLTTGEEDKLK